MDSKGRIRILLVTSNPPRLSQGGSRQFYHWFVANKNYECAVITDTVYPNKPPFECFQLSKIPFVERLLRTRMNRWAHDLIHLGLAYSLGQCKAFAEAFNPDVIVIGAETAVADVGIQLSKTLEIPLVGTFMDWPTFSAIGHEWCLKLLSSIYIKRYCACDLALCISPQMRDCLGPHPNSIVCYPCSPESPLGKRSQRRLSAPGTHLNVAFSGNLGQWYGGMLLDLSRTFEKMGRHRLLISGSHPSWSEAEELELRESGVYQGFLDEDAYLDFLEAADVLLVIMGFGEEARLIESTSFKSKLGEYFQAGRPVLVWGPAYCTAVEDARRHGFAYTVTELDALTVWRGCDQLGRSADTMETVVAAGRRFYREHLCADMISGFIGDKLKELTGRDKGMRK